MANPETVVFSQLFHLAVLGAWALPSSALVDEFSGVSLGCLMHVRSTISAFAHKAEHSPIPLFKAHMCSVSWVRKVVISDWVKTRLPILWCFCVCVCVCGR